MNRTALLTIMALVVMIAGLAGIAAGAFYRTAQDLREEERARIYNTGFAAGHAECAPVTLPASFTRDR